MAVTVRLDNVRVVNQGAGQGSGDFTSGTFSTAASTLLVAIVKADAQPFGGASGMNAAFRAITPTTSGTTWRKLIDSDTSTQAYTGMAAIYVADSPGAGSGRTFAMAGTGAWDTDTNAVDVTILEIDGGMALAANQNGKTGVSFSISGSGRDPGAQTLNWTGGGSAGTGGWLVAAFAGDGDNATTATAGASYTGSTGRSPGGSGLGPYLSSKDEWIASSGQSSTAWADLASAAAIYDYALVAVEIVVASAGQSATLSPATETDTAVAVTRNKRRTLGVASETDGAVALTRSKRRTLGAATETDTAIAVHLPGRLGPAAETDLAVAFAKAKRKTIGVAAETDAAAAITRAHRRTLGAAGETDAAVAFAKAKRKTLGVAGETDTAVAVTRVQDYPIPTSISGRNIVDQNGARFLMLCMSSWGMAQLQSNSEITTRLEGLAAAGFSAVMIDCAGAENSNIGSGWHAYTNKAGASFFTSTPWASSLGPAWSSTDWIVSEAARLGLIVNMSFFGGFGSTGAKADWSAVTNPQMKATGSAIATRYLGDPNIVWHLEIDGTEGPGSTVGSRAEALADGINTVEAAARPFRWMEPDNSQVSINSAGWRGTTQWQVPVNGTYVYGDNSATYEETTLGQAVVPWGDVEPPYHGAPYYSGNEAQQLRERTASVFILGGSFINYGDEAWWPFGADGVYGTAWTVDDVPTLPETLQAGYIFGLAKEFCAELTYGYSTSFVTTGLGTGDTRAAAGASSTVALAYFPNNRTIQVDTTILAGTGNVRLRWWDPVTGTWDSTIAASEAQQTGRSVTMPAARGDGTRDFVLVVELLQVVYSISPASETDTAIAVTRAKRRTLGPAAETDAAVAFTRSKRRTLGIATETDSALTIVRAHRRTLGAAAETDTAMALTHFKRRLILPAVETDLAVPITASIPGRINPAGELDTAITLVLAKRRTLGPATEVDVALAVLRAKRHQLGVATELDMAVALTVIGGADITYPAHSAIRWNTADITVRWTLPAVTVTWEN